LVNSGDADTFSDLIAEIFDHAVGSATWNPSQAATFIAQIALIARFQPWLFEGDEGTKIRSIVKAQRALCIQVVPSATAYLDAIVAQRALPKSPPLVLLLGSKGARPYLQKLADEWIVEVQDQLEVAGVHLALLCYVAPFVDLPATTVRHWLRRSR
jgi:hypothetical protein